MTKRYLHHSCDKGLLKHHRFACIPLFQRAVHILWHNILVCAAETIFQSSIVDGMLDLSIDRIIKKKSTRVDTYDRVKREIRVALVSSTYINTIAVKLIREHNVIRITRPFCYRIKSRVYTKRLRVCSNCHANITFLHDA